MKNNYHVNSRGDKWIVKGAGNLRASKVTETQKDAIAIAMKLARKQNVELIIHGRDGRIRQRNSYGNDPCPPKDER